MHSTSETYNRIVSGPHWFETSLSIGSAGVILTETGDELTFGGDSIVISSVAGEDGVRDDVLIRLKISHNVFSKNTPAVGCCVAGEIDVEMLNHSPVPRMARLTPFVRACNGTEKSEWIKKGVFYVDTRSYDVSADGEEIIILHGYDAMLMADKEYDTVGLQSTVDIDILNDIASRVGCGIDDRTVAAINKGYDFGSPIGYKCREVLGYIAAIYGGNFVISDEGNLLFVGLNGLPEQTNYLIDDVGESLVFDDSEGQYGEMLRILV